ncbi:hypothetical protein [Chryseobacterium sp. A301]
MGAFKPLQRRGHGANFLKDLVHKVETYLDGTLYKTVNEEAFIREGRIAVIKLPITGSEDFHLEMKIYKGAGRVRSIVLEEIQWH